MQAPREVRPLPFAPATPPTSPGARCAHLPPKALEPRRRKDRTTARPTGTSGGLLCFHAPSGLPIASAISVSPFFPTSRSISPPSPLCSRGHLSCDAPRGFLPPPRRDASPLPVANLHCLSTQRPRHGRVPTPRRLPPVLPRRVVAMTCGHPTAPATDAAIGRRHTTALHLHGTPGVQGSPRR